MLALKIENLVGSDKLKIPPISSPGVYKGKSICNVDCTYNALYIEELKKVNFH